MDPLELIPHRAPIRCLDRAVRCAADEAVAEQDLVPGPHLDGEGALWTGGLIEGLAQTAALLAGADAAGPAGPVAGVLASVRAFRVERRPRAGETVRYAVRPVTRLGGALLVWGEAKVGDERVASGRLQLHLAAAAP